MFRRLNLVANYTLYQRKKRGMPIGELFDYVNGVVRSLQRLRSVRLSRQARRPSRFVLAGTFMFRRGLRCANLPFAVGPPVPITLNPPAGSRLYLG